MLEQTGFSVVLELLARLKDAKIHSHISADRYGKITINSAVPGQLWEIDIAEDGTVEIEIFRSDGEIGDSKLLDELIAQFSD